MNYIVIVINSLLIIKIYGNLNTTKLTKAFVNKVFMAPGLKGLPGASSNRIVRPSVYPFVCPPVCL